MLKIENWEVLGWEHAIRGMRNPMNSWEKSDSNFFDDSEGHVCNICQGRGSMSLIEMGPNDHDLMMRLRNAGTDHRKFMRMITVYLDITAPLYWWKEFDTYKVGTVANSCSTMHKIADREFTFDDFSHEKLINSACMEIQEQHIRISPIQALATTIECLNSYRDLYLQTKDKKYWWQMIQLLPSSYNQKRTVMMNYEVLANIYESRKNHKLDEWSIGFMEWIERLPYSELICGPEFLSKKLHVGIDLAHGDDMKGGEI